MWFVCLLWYGCWLVVVLLLVCLYLCDCCGGLVIVCLCCVLTVAWVGFVCLRCNEFHYVVGVLWGALGVLLFVYVCCIDCFVGFWLFSSVCRFWWWFVCLILSVAGFCLCC